MLVELDYLAGLASRGGPIENQYAELNSVFASINKRRKQGIITDCDLETLWRNTSDAFYSPDTMQGFVITKPYGYAGDFEIIERIYEVWKSPKEHLVNWDNYFHAQTAPHAVRNRRHYFLSLLHELHDENTVTRVLNIASGPARGVREFLSTKNGSMFFECVDHDKHAVAYASSRAQQVSSHVQFHLANAFHFDSENTFDLVWSAGLFDYLDDRAFKILLKRLLRFVTAEGELVVGNFSPNNSTRDYMEFGNWNLNHRTVHHLIDLARESGVADENISVHSEPLGVNLFLHIRK